MKVFPIILLILFVFISCKKEHTNEVKACFEFYPNEINAGEVQFTNCSENATGFLWKFGDGQTSIEKAPMHLFERGFPFNVTLIAYNGNETDSISKRIHDDITVFKPNIYIYPLYQSSLCVNISFPMGGKIIESIPKYGDGWCVNVDTAGKIDNQYNYLFYESKQPNIFQYNKGWCVAQADLKVFFERNMALYNFSSSEIKDYIDYWIPLLNGNNYYRIYPQTNEIVDQTIRLDFSIQPNHIYRLFYGVIGADEYSKIEAPYIEPFKRIGYYIVEWGVFRK